MDKQGITGAEVVDVFNLPPYGCSRRLYFQKIGEKSIAPCYYASEQLIKSQVVISGDFVAEIYSKKTGRKVRTPNQNFHNPRYLFIIGDADRLQTNVKKPDGRGSYVPLEIRVLTPVEFYKIRRDGLPANYYNYQLHHQMIAKQATWASLALFCPDIMEMLTFDITYDETTAAEVINAERSFWEKIQKKEIIPYRMAYFTEEENIIATRKCDLCGYRHNCLQPYEGYGKNKKEKVELTETVNQINDYLKEK